MRFLTSVDRDGLKDMGSIIWAETVDAVRRISRERLWKRLIPWVPRGIRKHVDRLVEAAPEVISPNMAVKD